MARDLLVHLELPFFPDRDPIVFHKWFPLGQDDVLVFTEGNVVVRLWFNLDCLTPGDRDPAEIKRMFSVRAARVNADVEILGVSDELAEFIYQEKDRMSLGPVEHPDELYRRLRNEYLELGRVVLKSALQAFNRLIAYARISKAQYWLEPRLFDLDRMVSDFTEFRAKARIRDRDWIIWFPSWETIIRVRLEDQRKYITQEDWSDAKEIIGGSGRPNLVLELLANAEALASAGHRRSAIIEVVTALEIAISNFSGSPKHSELMQLERINRIDFASLKAQVGHLGVAATTKYLLPLLFDEQSLPTNTLKQCQSAIDIRGNVVHNGQRDVDESVLLPLLIAVREVCVVLANFTQSKVSIPILQMTG